MSKNRELERLSQKLELASDLQGIMIVTADGPSHGDGEFKFGNLRVAPDHPCRLAGEADSETDSELDSEPAGY